MEAALMRRRRDVVEKDGNPAESHDDFLAALLENDCWSGNIVVEMSRAGKHRRNRQ